MGPGVVYPGILQRLCREPLGEVKCVQLRGRGIVRLEGLDSCPNLTSLDVSRNSLKQLDGAGLERCKELWIVDASHNQLDNLGGLRCLMAMGYLNLSSNRIPLEGLRPLARTHVLELCLGSSDRSPEKRRGILGLLPNVWVLDGEYVTARERCAADSYDKPNPRDHEVGSGHLLGGERIGLMREPDTQNPYRQGDAGGAGCSQQQADGGSNGGGGIGQQEYRDLLQQGRQTKEFFENVVWKLPCRTGSADPFRLTTLIKRYDHRAVVSNKSAWLGSFTCKDSGARRERRGSSLPLPRSHSEALLSLPLEVKLDVAVLLTVRAAFRESVPQQVLAEAFMVLLVQQKGLPEGIHNDLSRVPPFICTALVHVLRSSILLSIHEVTDQGCADTTAPPLLDRVETNLLDAIPPVVTGVYNAIDKWETSSRTTLGRGVTDTPCGSGRGIGVATGALSDRLAENSGGGEGCDSLLSIDLGSVAATSEPRLPCESDMDDLSIREEYRSEEGGGALASSAWAAEAGVPATEASPEKAGPPETLARAGGGGFAVDGDDDGLETHASSLPSVGLNRLCRRAVVLLTRSPACPDLVECQTEPANQRIYDQMGPLLERAHMSFRDLHPESSFGGSVSGGENGADTSCETYVDRTMGDSVTPPRLSSPATSSECSGDEGFDYGPSGSGGGDEKNAGRGLAEEVGSADAASTWCTSSRSPKVGERVQVLHDTSSVILHANADTFCITVAPFQGVQSPPYNGNPRVDSRDLFYDSRGWWKHAKAVKTNAPEGSGRLHRLSRGLSASGLPWGAGSLNEPLGGGRGEAAGSEGGRLGGEENGTSPDLAGPLCKPETQLLGASSGSDDNTGASAEKRVASLGASGVTLTPAVSSAPRRCSKGVVGIFSAEGSWDPAFVVAPGRLVALQNKAAARRRGVRRARQVAWHRIDGPEASVAPRPMMPRCFSFTTATDGGGTCGTCAPVRSITSIPGLGRSKPGRDARSPRQLTPIAAPYHGGRGHARHGSASRSASPPPRAGDSSATGGQASAVEAWLELQREMGSLKADNRLRSRGSSRDGTTTNSLARRPMQGSSASLPTKQPVGNSSDDDSAGTTSDVPATASPREAELPTSARRDIPEDTSTAVFELTQVSGGGHHPGGSGAAATAAVAAVAAATATALVSPSGATATAEGRQMAGEPRASTESERNGGRHQTSADDERLRRRGKRRKSGQVGSGFGNSNSISSNGSSDGRGDSTTPATWKPFAYRSLEWFNVPSRKLLLVDPSSASTVSRPTTATATAAGAAAAVAAADQATGLSQGVDIKPTGQKLKGDSGGVGSGGGGGVGGGDRSGDVGEINPGGNHGHRQSDISQGKGVGQPTRGVGGRKAVVRDADGGNTSAPKTFPPAAVLVRLPLYSATEAATGFGSGSRDNFKPSGPNDQASQTHALRASTQAPARLAATPPKLKPIVAPETIQERSAIEAVLGGSPEETCRVSPSLLVGSGGIRSLTPERGPRDLPPNERRRGCGGSMDRSPLPEGSRLAVTPQRPTLRCRAPYVAGVSLSPPASKRNISPCITPSCVRRVPPPPIVARRSLSAPVSVSHSEGNDKALMSRDPLSTGVRSHGMELENVVPTSLVDSAKGSNAASRGHASGARTCGGDARSITPSLNSDNDSSLAASLYAPPAPQSPGDVVPPAVAKVSSANDLDECVSIDSINSLCEWNRATVPK